MTAAERLDAALETLTLNKSLSAARALFGDQRCPTCGDEHPGESCPEPDLFGGVA